MDPSDFDPIWRGSKEIEECLGSPKIKRTARGWTAVRTYDGVFTELQAKAPDIGSKMADMGELMVDEVNIEPTGGGAGLMTVTMLLDSQAGIGAPADPVFEIEWIEVQKDITRHWRYNVGGPDELDQDVGEDFGGAGGLCRIHPGHHRDGDAHAAAPGSKRGRGIYRRASGRCDGSCGLAMAAHGGSHDAPGQPLECAAAVDWCALH